MPKVPDYLTVKATITPSDSLYFTALVAFPQNVKRNGLRPQTARKPTQNDIWTNPKCRAHLLTVLF